MNARGNLDLSCRVALFLRKLCSLGRHLSTLRQQVEPFQCERVSGYPTLVFYPAVKKEKKCAPQQSEESCLNSR